jgi:DNA mismatch endonuclease, patch repair protein
LHDSLVFCASCRSILQLMADVFTKTKRSEVMSRVRGKGNKNTELRLIAIMRANSIGGWRRGSKLIGRPDFVFSRGRLAVFVDGCFWHGCPIHGTMPKQNARFWFEKIAGNRSRDRRVSRSLRSQGWQVLRIWEHELKRRNEPRLLARLERALVVAEHSTANRIPSRAVPGRGRASAILPTRIILTGLTHSRFDPHHG